LKNKKLILLRDLLLAAFVSFVAASISHTQFVLYELSNIGVEIDLATRLSASLQDLIGFLPAFLPVITLGLAIGFGITAWILSRFNSKQNGWYLLAGGVSLLMIHTLMHPILEITLIAGARSFSGLMMQTIAGIIGGSLFYLLRKA